MKTLKITISGRVQGVGYRWFAVRCAQKYAVTGWVRNLPDGSVETCVQGEENQLDFLLEMLKKGPVSASVKHFEAVEITTNEYFQQFEVRY